MDATIAQRTAAWERLLRSPPAPSRGVCEICLGLCGRAKRCRACRRSDRYANAVLPIAYSLHRGALHHALREYKRGRGAATAHRFALDLAALLWRFLVLHERCLAAASGVEGFDLATVVPARQSSRHTLAAIVAALEPTAARFVDLLMATRPRLGSRRVDPRRFECRRDLDGARVLLIDDTWTTGSSAQSAAGALRGAGAVAVGVIVVGRHLRPADGGSAPATLGPDRRFDWSWCARHVATGALPCPADGCLPRSGGGAV